MGASSARPSSREMAFRNTEKHGNPQLKASGEVAPTQMCRHQSENVDPTPTQFCRRRAGRVVSLEAALQVMGDFQGPEVDVLKNSLSRAKHAAQTSIEGTACTERRVHPAFAEANCIFGAGTRRRTGVVGLVRHERLKQEVAAAEPVPAEVSMQESSTEMLFLRAKVAQLEAERIPHPVPRVHRHGRELAVAVDEAQDRELSRGQFADESTRSSFMVGSKAVGVARCPRRSRHGISQFTDGTDFQKRLCHEQFVAAIFGGAHGALIGAWREAGYGLRGTRIGEAPNPGPRRVRTIQSVDSDDTPFVGTVVPAPSTPGAHHDCRVGFKVRDDIRKRMRLTSDWQTRVSEATTGESIDDTLLDWHRFRCSPRSRENKCYASRFRRRTFDDPACGQVFHLRVQAMVHFQEQAIEEGWLRK